MATLQSVNDLKTYCMRKLGDPVINIEVDTIQADDRIDDAIAYFVERHYNGTEEVFFHHTVHRTDIDAGYITIPHEYVAMLDVLSGTKPTSGEPQFDFQVRFMRDLNDRQVGGANAGTMSEFYLSMSHLALMQNMLSPTRDFLYNSITNHLYPKWKFTDVGSQNILNDASDISTAQWVKVNATATANDAVDPFSANNADTVTSDAAGVFSISQTIVTKTYVRGAFTTAFSIKQGSYTGDLTMTITDSQGTVVHSAVITPSNLWNKQFIEFTYTAAHADNITVTLEGTATAAGETFSVYNPWVYMNNILVFHGYKALNAGTDLNVYNDRWVKEYATALIKQQWGTNLKKFDGVQMPGGVTLNGQTIHDEATTEIENLMEKFAEEYEEIPVGMWA